MRPIPEAAVWLLTVEGAGAGAIELLTYGHCAILCPSFQHPKHVWSEAEVALLLFLD